MRYPPAPRRRRWPSRILGVLATAALLGTGVAIATMVIPKPEQEAAASSTPQAVTEPAPAKAGLTEAQKAARKAAVTTLNEQGFKPVRIADWHPEHTMRVLIGRDDAGAERAFFFVKRRFVGNDDAAASAVRARQRRARERRHAHLPTVRPRRPGVLPEGRAGQGRASAGRTARSCPRPRSRPPSSGSR